MYYIIYYIKYNHIIRNISMNIQGKTIHKNRPKTMILEITSLRSALLTNSKHQAWDNIALSQQLQRITN